MPRRTGRGACVAAHVPGRTVVVDRAAGHLSTAQAALARLIELAYGACA